MSEQPTFEQNSPPCTEAPLIKERDRVAGVDKAAQVIAAFGQQRGPGLRSGKLTLADVAAETGLSRAAARRYVLTLHHLGFVQNQGKLFCLTTKVLELGQQYALAMGHLPAYKSLCLQLSHAVGEASSVSVLHKGQIVGVAFNAAEQFTPIWARPGITLPAHCTAAGRVLMAMQLNDGLEEQLEATKFEKFTPFTCATARDALAHIQRAEQLGFASEEQELEMGHRSIAVALKTGSGATVAALSVHVGHNRLSMEEMQHSILPTLRKLQSLATRDSLD